MLQPIVYFTTAITSSKKVHNCGKRTLSGLLSEGLTALLEYLDILIKWYSNTV